MKRVRVVDCNEWMNCNLYGNQYMHNAKHSINCSFVLRTSQECNDYDDDYDDGNTPPMTCPPKRNDTTNWIGGQPWASACECQVSQIIHFARARSIDTCRGIRPPQVTVRSFVRSRLYDALYPYSHTPTHIPQPSLSITMVEVITGWHLNESVRGRFADWTHSLSHSHYAGNVRPVMIGWDSIGS